MKLYLRLDGITWLCHVTVVYCQLPYSFTIFAY